MFVSVYCLQMLMRAPTVAGFSWHIGWMRSLGTGMNTVFMLMHYPGNHFLHTLALTSLVLDACYLVLFRRKLAAAA
jgi:hypothetical protein